MRLAHAIEHDAQQWRPEVARQSDEIDEPHREIEHTGQQHWWSAATEHPVPVITKKPPRRSTPSQATIGPRRVRSREHGMSVAPMNAAINPNTCNSMPGCSVGISCTEAAENCSPTPETTLIMAIQNTKAFSGRAPPDG